MTFATAIHLSDGTDSITCCIKEFLHVIGVVGYPMTVEHYSNAEITSDDINMDCGNPTHL
jgi:hypothetical protein